jgi:L-threonylcarbamoyladenylate synthase
MGNIILPADSGITLRSAADCILKGGIIAYPTETIYGLGARYDDEQAMDRLYQLKRRPEDKTMPLIIGDIKNLGLLAEFVTDSAKILIASYWPGPLTLVFRAKKGLSSFITCDSGIALRMPGESFALNLVRAIGMPITSTSANISGMPPATNALSAARYFGADIDMIVDGGESPASKPSTIVDVTREKFRILREGPISSSDILALIHKR